MGETGDGADSVGDLARYPAGLNSGATTICPRDVVEPDLLHRLVVGVVQKAPSRLSVGEADHDRAIRRLTLGGLRAGACDQHLSAILLQERPHPRQVLVAVPVNVMDLLHQNKTRIRLHAGNGHRARRITAVVVPAADFLRLRALEQAASPQETEDAEDTAALEWKARTLMAYDVRACGGGTAPARHTRVSLRLITNQQRSHEPGGPDSSTTRSAYARSWTRSIGWPANKPGTSPATAERDDVPASARASCCSHSVSRHSTINECSRDDSAASSSAGRLSQRQRLRRPPLP